MKKLSMLVCALGLAFVVASCCNGKEDKQSDAAPGKECCRKEAKCELTEEQRAECQAVREQWAKFEALTDAEKTDVIAKRKAFIDKANAEKEACKAKKAELEARWATFETLSLDEQKQLIDDITAFCHADKKPCHKESKKGCCKEGKKECAKEGKKCHEDGQDKK
ncbi:MAG: hypothetical protein LBS16_04880 [Prevotellaceae bacterium]|jgi:hypothetical protein|nr:hypothetical protein [Prevotellaceae bacterium]